MPDVIVNAGSPYKQKLYDDGSGNLVPYSHGDGSGAVTANQGTPNTAANAWPVEVTDGTNVLGTSTHPMAARQSDGTNQITLNANSGTPAEPVVLYDGTGNILFKTANPGAVQGNVASLSADSGNPVKVGGVYNASAPTPTSGQRVDLQTDATGALYVNPGALRQTSDAVDTLHYGTPSAGTSVSVGTASTAVLGANASRKGLILTNASANVITVDLSGGTAVALKGVVLIANGVPFAVPANYVPTSAITAIASAASSTLAIQELV